MGFFGKLKNLAGVGGAKVTLKVDPTIKKDAGTINGSVLITSKSDQHLLTLKVKLEQRITTGRGDDKDRKRYKLGEIREVLNMDIVKDEEMTMDFEVPFKLNAGTMDNLASKGGALGAIGKVGKFASNEKI